MKKGIVYFIGAGPGDAELITVKGRRALREADVVVYDRLVNPFLLTEAKEDAKLIYCGKQPCKHTLRQEDIQKELLIHAKKGKTVVRLKGGDPGVFGRVGEEAELLAEHQISYEIVPGITAGIAATMYAGVPITHRAHSRSFAVVTGHTKTSDGKPDVNWQSLAESVDTVVFYMGVKHIRTIADELVKNGKDPKTAVMVTQWGTYSKQQTIEGTLATIANLAEGNVQNPSIIVVGDVVKLRPKLKWFEDRLLQGKGILFPATTDAEKDMAKELRAKGADVYSHPKITEFSTNKELEMARNLETVEIYEEIIFLSPQAVQTFLKVVGANRFDLRAVRATFYAGNWETQQALEASGYIAERCGEEREWKKPLFIGGEAEIESLSFSKRGLADVWLSSEQMVAQKEQASLARLIEEKHVDTLFVASRLEARKLVTFLRLSGMNVTELTGQLHIICQGREASHILRASRIEADVVLAETSTIDDVLGALVEPVVLAEAVN
ncbi:uroporphyrinogen-III C-methyltransferase [Alkalihalophilus lindianensis]|uniref:uroporphyrinogen-III C-methyltransferase n=2 Tax=Bacillaceae TaxID=186817 RepID=A0ABU3X8Y3_9BACI|nr:uroporphyrinogen-III C-methyltransferase [Alkalihalophilus lindianensis]MDV2684283.1 uroporphyrinogen-III C-methyltransferase [Alkalihalophilus lindianensis]